MFCLSAAAASHLAIFLSTQLQLHILSITVYSVCLGIIIMIFENGLFKWMSVEEWVQ